MPSRADELPLEGTITQGSRIFVALCAGTMVIIIWVSVFARYVLSNPLPWPEQLAKYLMIWMALVGASLGVRAHAHVAVDLLVNALPKKLGLAFEVIAVILTGIFLLLAIYYGILFTWQARTFSDPVLNNMSLAFAYAAVPAGCVLMLLQLVFVSRRGFVPSGDTTSVM